MANISITSQCNQHCKYCFARDYYRRYSPGIEFMSDSLFHDALDFLDRSGIQQVRLLGGEPTLHPRFIDFMEEIRRKGLPTMIFSNGLIEDPVLEYIDSRNNRDVALVIHLAMTGRSSEKAIRRQRRTLKILGEKAMIGINIDRPSDDLSGLLETVRRFGLAPYIRLGLAHPSLVGSNQYLHPGRYGDVGLSLIQLLEEGEMQGVGFHFDCGFVPCLFRSLPWERVRDVLSRAVFVCGPVPDILADGSLVPCYPLAGWISPERLDLFDTATDSIQFFKEKMDRYRNTGIFRECGECIFREHGICAGGCLALAIKRMRSEKFSFKMLENKKRKRYIYSYNSEEVGNEKEKNRE